MLLASAKKLLKHFGKDTRGVTAIEYAIIAVAVSAIVYGMFYGSGKNGEGLKGALNSAMTTVTSNISKANTEGKAGS